MGLKVNRESTPSSEMKDDAAAVEQVNQDAGKTGTQTATMQTNTEDQGQAGNGESGDGEGSDDDAAGDQGQGEYVGAEGAADNGDGYGEYAGAEQETDDPALVEEQAEESVKQATSQATELAVSSGKADTLPAVGTVSGAAANFFKQMMDSLAASGQEGLELGYGVFPTISLDKGEFKIGDEELDDESFKGVPLFSKPKYAYRTTGVSEKEVEAVFADSDEEHKDSNSAVSAKLIEWKMKHPDSGYEIKKYQNVYWYMTELKSKPDAVGQLFICSVSPTSIRRYTNACMFATQKGYPPHECVFEAKVGEKVRGEFDFYPWDFKVQGSCKKLGVNVKFGGEKDEDF